MIWAVLSLAVLLFLLGVGLLVYKNSDPGASFEDEELSDEEPSHLSLEVIARRFTEQAEAEAESRTPEPLPVETAPLPVKERRESPAKQSPAKPAFSLGPGSWEEASRRVETASVQSQCDLLPTPPRPIDRSDSSPVRPLHELKTLLEGCEDRREALCGLSDPELASLVAGRELKAYQLEKELGDCERAVAVRRFWLAQKMGPRGQSALDGIPHQHFDYKTVLGACAENVVGYVPLPLGFAGPLRVNGAEVFVPMATTEGCLIASTHRGCLALSKGAGVRAEVLEDGMTRAAIVRFPSLRETAQFVAWTEETEAFRFMKQTFEEGSRHTRLSTVSCTLGSGRLAYLRFKAKTGDAMGMNMVSKGTEKVLRLLSEQFFPEMRVESLSGNLCVDKKPAALNWIEGRGKSVVAEAVVPASAVAAVLKTSTKALVALGVSKNLMGSALAGTVGGFNAHAANIVTAVFAATGQDVAQNVSSSACLTSLEEEANGDLYVSVRMPSIEVGTVGGGTVLGPQAAALRLLGVAGGDPERGGGHACRLAQVVAAAVVAGELSLLAALASGDLVRSHLRHNRSSQRLVSESGEAQPPCPSQGSLRGFGGDLASLGQRSLKGSSLHPDTCSKVLT